MNPRTRYTSVANFLLPICSTSLALLTAQPASQAEPLPELKVSDNHHFLVTKSGQPFFG